MSDRLGEDALLDVGRCLNRFDVDSIQCLTRKSQAYLAGKTHILPVRLLDTAMIGGDHTSVSARGGTRGSVSFDGTTQDAFQRGLAAIRDSDLKRLTLCDPAGEPINDGELERVAEVAATVKVASLHFWCDLRHLPAPPLRRLVFGFRGVNQLYLYRFNGHQLADDLLRDQRRVLDYLYAPEYGMRNRELVLPAFHASPQCVSKLVERAAQATNIDYLYLNVTHLPLRSQQLDGFLLTENEGTTKYEESLEEGNLAFTFDTSFRLHLVNFG